MNRKIWLWVMALTTLSALMLSGCGTPQQKAQKLYDQGKYQEVVALYPDLPIAVQAKEKIAEGMLNRGDYARLIEFFPDSPYAVQAKNKLAEELFNQGQYQDVITQYPESPHAKIAKDKLANDLLTKAQADSNITHQKEIYEQICVDYPGTQAAAAAKKALTAPEPAKKTPVKKPAKRK
ncbi:MAG: hypothetical protein NTW14_12095 [bacterium]|nr:hypothetical protein [bacterium]